MNRNLNHTMIEELHNRPDLWGYIQMISEADYGCEELPPDAKVKDRVVVITADSQSESNESKESNESNGLNEVVCEVEDEFLVSHGLDEGSYISKELKPVFLKKRAY